LQPGAFLCDAKGAEGACTSSLPTNVYRVSFGFFFFATSTVLS
jgi:hypothetical protein